MLRYRWALSAALGLVVLPCLPAVAQQPSLPGEIAPAASAPVVRLTKGLVTLIDQAEVPAQEAGVLAEIRVRAGAKVRAGELMARINDRRPEIEKRLAQVEYGTAREKADNDINIRYAKAAADVSEAEYQAAEDSNRRVPNSFPAIEIRKLKLQHRRALLQIEQSELEQSVARGEAQVAATKIEAADENTRRHKIVSPIDGFVDDVRVHVGEWMQPGEVVVHVIRLDRLRIVCFVREADRARIAGRNCTVEVEVPGIGTRELPGKVVFVSDVTQNGRDYRVHVEVDNRQENEQWLLRPGNQVALRIE